MGLSQKTVSFLWVMKSDEVGKLSYGSYLILSLKVLRLAH